jgi:hypothetical protein
MEETGLPAGLAAAHYRFHFAEVRPAAGDVETVLGYPRGGAPDPVSHAIGEMLASDEELWSIEGGFVEYSGVGFDDAAHGLEIGGQRFEVGRIVSGQLRRAEGMAVFLCTAGPGIEAHSRGLMSAGDPFNGYIADTVGSLVVERAMDRVHDRLEAAATVRGLRITNRYSPGYCGWKVAEQHKLFRLLPSGFCGVTLNDSALMRPIKSVSGVIGIGPNVRRNPYTCNLCEMEQCLYRSLQGEPEPAPAPEGTRSLPTS